MGFYRLCVSIDYDTIHRYAKANNKYMKNYDEIKDSSFTQYLDKNSLYGWTMS